MATPDSVLRYLMWFIWSEGIKVNWLDRSPTSLNDLPYFDPSFIGYEIEFLDMDAARLMVYLCDKGNPWRCYAKGIGPKRRIHFHLAENEEILLKLGLKPNAL